MTVSCFENASDENDNRKKMRKVGNVPKTVPILPEDLDHKMDVVGTIEGEMIVWE
jgi:hypothetical protein